MNPFGCALDSFFNPYGKVGSSLFGNAKVVQRATGLHSLEAFRVLEPYAVKVARTVLRRERRGNPPDLSDKICKISKPP